MVADGDHLLSDVVALCPQPMAIVQFSSQLRDFKLQLRIQALPESLVDLIQIPMKNFHNDLRLEDNAAKKNREWSCGHMWMFDCKRCQAPSFYKYFRWTDNVTVLAPPIDTTYRPS